LSHLFRRRADRWRSSGRHDHVGALQPPAARQRLSGGCGSVSEAAGDCLRGPFARVIGVTRV